ncbi:MAG: hypothetical protein KDI01_03405 [Halioglobus sp.]|nr:hypothetical protein [Halioglobus sp.]
MTQARRTGPGKRRAIITCLMLLSLGLLGACCRTPAPEVDSSADSGGASAARAGFADTGRTVAGFAHARPGTALTFPRDHGPHPDFRIEWWYLTANLEDARGEPLGLQWTLFRQAQRPPDKAGDRHSMIVDRHSAETGMDRHSASGHSASVDRHSTEPATSGDRHFESTSGDRHFESAAKPGSELVDRHWAGPWAADQLWMAHMAVSRGPRHRVAERFARGSGTPDPVPPRQAGVTLGPFRAWLDDWHLESLAANSADDPLDHLRLSARAEDENGVFGYRLELEATGPLVRHGDKGFSQKSADGQGSMYYSQPFYRVSGEVTLDGERIAVSGRAWLDREWSSQLLGAGQTGWDWFSLHLDSGDRLMAFRLRGGGSGTKGGNYLSGSWITAAGDVVPLHGSGLTLTPLASAAASGHRVPVSWRLTLPEKQLELDITARHANRWMPTSVPYWEGAVSVRDAASGSPRGEGYLEMTGY